MQEFMDAPEYSIDCFVFATSSPQSFNDTGVVTVEDNTTASDRESGDRVDQHFEADGLCPCNVSLSISCGLPTWYQSPGMPLIANGYADTYSRACI
jgi:hypothetical protein